LFNVVFLVELMVNMYGSWFRLFIRRYWNWFDVVVVTLGAIDLCRIELPAALKLVRMLRAFRVFRLFGKFESFIKILTTVQKALAGVTAAFLLLGIVLCIYAVLAVDFFKDIYGACHDNPDHPLATTPRGYCFGADYYGNFLRALYTLFQVLTGESWSEAAVRPVLHYYADSNRDTFGVAVFFISFVSVNGIVLLNVVVAVLLEGMSQSDAELHPREEVQDSTEDDPAEIHRGDEYEEINEYQRKILQEVDVAEQDIAKTEAQLHLVRSELREQCQAIVAALKESRPAQYL
jgi:hypothetical protein